MKWLPIETAPKDGTSVLVTCAHFSYATAQVAFWDRNNWRVDDGSNCLIHDFTSPHAKFNGVVALAPTHWMPLPEPPK